MDYYDAQQLVMAIVNGPNPNSPQNVSDYADLRHIMFDIEDDLRTLLNS